MKCAIYRWIVFIKLSNQNHSNHKIIIYSISHFVVNLYEQSFAIVWQVESPSNFAKKNTILYKLQNGYCNKKVFVLIFLKFCFEKEEMVKVTAGDVKMWTKLHSKRFYW